LANQTVCCDLDWSRQSRPPGLVLTFKRKDFFRFVKLQDMNHKIIFLFSVFKKLIHPLSVSVSYFSP
jgi:hypothetical protein